MSNASLKEQLQAVASQLSDELSDVTLAKKTLPSVTTSFANKNIGKNKTKTHERQQNRQLVKPKKPKPKWLDYVQYGVDLLRLYFPASFKLVNEVRPLKKGIKQDILKRLSTIDSIATEDKACMVRSLAYYVNTIAYHKVVVEGAARIDLDGEQAGHVSAEEAKYSYDRCQAKLQARIHSKKEGITS